MTPAPRPEYVTDVPYVRSFVEELSPARLRLVAALNGFPAPPAEDFDYCELGAAHGDTTATLAAANPSARFVGVDLNPEHIASANRLAHDGGLANARFLEKDFTELLREDLPAFDFIGAHGVLSWVGPAKRKAVIEIAAAKLKPGGLLYVSYNALPGWAAVEPLRRLLLDRGAAVVGGSLERAKEGLALAKRLSDAGAEYFANNPPAKAMLATLERVALPYVVHEYLHAHWAPMYFGDVATDMAASGLHFIGQLPLFLNYRDLAIPAKLLPLFEGVEDRVTFESLKDYAINEYFRRDVYVKGRPPRADDETRAYLDATPFGTALRPGPVGREVRLPHYTLQFAGEIFDALLPALGEGATTVPALAQRPELVGFGLTRIRDAVRRLVLGGQVSPMLHATHAPLPGDTPDLTIPSLYNRMLLARPLAADVPIVLAAPAAGTGIALSMLHAVALRLLTEAPHAERRAWVHALLARQPFLLKVGGRPVEGDQERALMAEVEDFRVTRLPKLMELGVVT